jgi:hypothetical protein
MGWGRPPSQGFDHHAPHTPNKMNALPGLLVNSLNQWITTLSHRNDSYVDGITASITKI